MRKTRESLPTSIGSVTAMPGKTTISSSGTTLRSVMPSKIRQVLYDVNNWPNKLYSDGETPGSSRQRGLGASAALLLHAARDAPSPGRRPAALTRAVPRAAPDRARPAHHDGRASRDPRLRRLQRHGARGPARIPWAGASPLFGGGSPGQGIGAHPNGLPTPGLAARSLDRTARRSRAAVSPRKAGARANLGPLARVGILHRGRAPTCRARPNRSGLPSEETR